MSEIVPVKWVSTAEAIERLLSTDEEWCRLSDSFHRAPDIRRSSKRRANNSKHRAAARDALQTRRDALIDPVLSDVAAGKLIVVLLAPTVGGGWLEHQLASKYLGSPELPAALTTSRAGKLRLMGPDTRLRDASLYFQASEWECRLSSSAVGRPPKGGDTADRNPARKTQTLIEAARQWFAKNYPGGSGVKMNKTLAAECSVALGRTVGERTMRRAMGRK